MLRWADRHGRGLLAAVLATACATGLTGCSSHPASEGAPITWEQRLALGRLEQAEKLLDGGDLEGARRTAEVALTEARQAAHPPTIARAQALLAALRGDVIQLQEATDMLERLQDAPGLAHARLMLAELAVSANRPDIAVPAMRAAVAALPSDLGGQLDSAATQARVFHLQAAALREGHLFPEAAAAERRASLLLTLLPDKEQLLLRAGVAQGCGDDLYRILDARGAIVQHAHAANCARLAGERALELRALASLAADFGLDGQWRASADHSERALRLALDLHDTSAAHDAANRGLQALRELHEPASSARWQVFEQALDG
ncbi:MAG TPA: hypothetical protein VFY71_01310 [Planctomycetota bacterium]|nr:hypothetical protein [Planctomycetota bacterium]